MQMRSSPAIFLDVSRSVRAQIAIDEYGELPQDEIKNAIERVTKRMGGSEHESRVRGARSRRTSRTCVDLLLDYYDKSYLNAKARSPRKHFVDMKTDAPLSNETVTKLIEHSRAFCKAV